MNGGVAADEVAHAAKMVRAQRALVVDLAKAKRFDQLPAAHQALRQMEDALKRSRAGTRLEQVLIDVNHCSLPDAGAL